VTPSRVNGSVMLADHMSKNIRTVARVEGWETTYVCILNANHPRKSLIISTHSHPTLGAGDFSVARYRCRQHAPLPPDHGNDTASGACRMYTVPSSQIDVRFRNDDSYRIRKTCVELGFVFSIFPELCLVVAKKISLTFRRSYRPDGYETN